MKTLNNLVVILKDRYIMCLWRTFEVGLILCTRLALDNEIQSSI